MNAVILAAGMSTRMGRQKMLLPLGGKAMIFAVAEKFLGAGCSVYVVTTAEVFNAARLGSLPATIVTNDSPERGQSHSLKLGLAALPPGGDFCIALGDLPRVSSEEIARQAEAFGNLPVCRSALVPRRDGILGHPSFFRAVWAERFLACSGDEGGRGILSAYEPEIEYCRGEDSFFNDVDTPDDYSSLNPVVV